MGNFEIYHYQYGTPIRYFYGSKPCYLIVWDEGCAVGHIWLQEGIKSEYELDAYVRSIYKRLSNENVAIIEPTLSVVICTRNRTLALERCILQLMYSDDQDFELIVVDNAPVTADTRNMLYKYPAVKYIREDRKGLDIARNTGARHAGNTIVAYTDDDVLVHPSWVTNIKKSFADSRTMAVTGLVLPLSLTTDAQVFFEQFWSFNKGYQRIVYDQNYFQEHCYYTPPVWEIGAGANMAFRKDAFFFNGYFDERLDVGAAGCSGDSAYWYKILANGWNCVYNPAAIVFHEHRQTEAELKSQLHAYMRGQVASLFVQYEWFGEKGNLRRIYKALPQYYWQRIREKLLLRNKAFNRYLFAEIRGAISGAFFYWHNSKNERLIRSGLFNPAPAIENVLVSIVITNYNYAHYLPDAINSCLQQIHANIEIIVVDDGSTDNSVEVIASFSTVKLVRTNHIGLSAARNIGVANANGAYVLFLDADDFLMPDAIFYHLYYFNYYPSAVCSIGDHTRVDAAGNELPVRIHKTFEGDAYASLLEGNFIAMEGAVMYRKELFDYFSFDINLQSCEDYDINLAICRYFPLISHKHVVAVYRIHGLSMSQNKIRMWESIQKVYEKNKSKIQFPEEFEAYKRGIENWKSAYLNE